MCIKEQLGHSNGQVALMVTVVAMKEMCVLVVMMMVVMVIETEFPRGGLELEAPVIQVTRAVPPPSD